MENTIFLFLASGIFIAYVVVGYPLLLALLTRRPGKSRLRRWEPRSVSLLLPVHNGEPWIREKLQSILQLDYPHDLLQIIVVSDGSTDRTEGLVRACPDPRIELVRLPRGGKARALNAAIAQAHGEILFFTDVRQRLEAVSLRRLVECFADPAVGVVSGELVLGQGTGCEEAAVGLYWQYEKWIRKRLSRLDSVPGATGCIYAMRRELAVPLPEDMLVDDVYLPLAAFFRGYRIILEDSARAFDEPAALRAEFARKVRTLAGIYQIIAAYPALLVPANRMWFHFASHKFARLLLPWALPVNFLAAFGLPGWWNSLAVLAHLALYALAWLDLWLPEGSLLKRLSSPARAFVVLLAAALCAASVVFLPGRTLWKETRVSAKLPS